MPIQLAKYISQKEKRQIDRETYLTTARLTQWAGVVLPVREDKVVVRAVIRCCVKRERWKSMLGANLTKEILNDQC